jgi:signal transduction histidine kinase
MMLEGASRPTPRERRNTIAGVSLGGGPDAGRRTDRERRAPAAHRDGPGRQLGRIVERLELERQLDVVAAREQRRLGRELHDGIGQTLLENALEHAHADRIDLRLHQADGVLTLEIRDDGRGMEGHPRNAEGAGLRIMRHRAAICGAGLEVSSGPNQGTVVCCRLRLLRGNAAR